MSRNEAIQVLISLKDSLQTLTQDEVDDPEEIVSELGANAEDYIEALDALMNEDEDRL